MKKKTGMCRGLPLEAKCCPLCGKKCEDMDTMFFVRCMHCGVMKVVVVKTEGSILITSDPDDEDKVVL